MIALFYRQELLATTCSLYLIDLRDGRVAVIMRKVSDIKGRPMRGIGRKAIVIVLGGALLIQPLAAIAPLNWNKAVIEQAFAATTSTLKLSNESVITSGAKRQDYIWTTTRSSKQVQTEVHVIEVDLSNPYVSLNAMSGKNNSVGQVNTIMGMAKENNAVAAINGDVYVMANEGAPLGAQIISGTLLSTPAKLKGMYAFAVDNNRKPSIDNYSFQGTVTAENGATFQLAGINESAYNPEGTSSVYSHVDTMFIYTSAWGGTERPKNSYTAPTEVLVREGVIEEISVGTALASKAPENGYILRTHGAGAEFVKNNLSVGQTITADYSLVSLTTGAKVDASSLQMLVGGHTLLVDKGAAATFTRDIAGVSGSSYTSRSAVGYSKDGTKVYLITSEKNGSNTGVSLKEMQQIMLQLGVYKGVNLDGGGSTTMVERPLGSFSLQLAHPTQSGTTQRYVSNGIGVFTSAPAGDVKGLIMSGSKTLLKGQSASYAIKGYDTYFNPVAIDNASTAYSSSAAIGTMEGNTFTATKVGKTKINATYGGASVSYDVEVVGQEAITSMTAATTGTLAVGASTAAPVTIKLKNGTTHKVNADVLDWEFVGFEAEVKGNTITVKSVEKGMTQGYAVGRYDGYPVMIPFAAGDSFKSFETFEVSSYLISSQAVPETTKASVKLVSDFPEQTSRGLKISYDFTEGTGTKAAYAVFGSSGRTLSGKPTSMSLDVYSDNSKNWLRAEFIDANNKTHLLDIAKSLNWTGWKNVSIDLASAGMAYPVKLNRIYAVTIEEGASERALTGEIVIDNLSLHYPPAVKEIPKASVVMNVGSTTAKVNGKSITLDTAPFTINGVTYVPVRFVSEAFGSQVLYDHPTLRVSVLRGNDIVEMFINKKDLLVNGVKGQADVTPIVRNGRTMVPIRLFSEKLGFTVNYEAKTKKITID